MLTADVVPAESARYAASLLIVPGLWAGTSGWRGFASYLAHRGWECHLLDLRGEGGVAGRAAAVVGYAAGLPARPVLVGHDAGALIALAATTPAHALATVLMAPLVPASPELRALVPGVRPLLGILLGRPVKPPTGAAATLLWGELPASLRDRVVEGAGPEDATFVRELLAGRTVPAGAAGVPMLILTGDGDPFLPAAGQTAGALGAEHQTLAGAGHWPHMGPTWKHTVGILHRWLVQRLGEPLLELYPEAMAERDDED